LQRFWQANSTALFGGLILHQKSQKTMAASRFTIFGEIHRMGSYLLVIHLEKAVQLAFGKFQHGTLFTIPEGDYLYIGSALGGATSGAPLARRVLRHASRSGGKAHHHIRDAMLQLFLEQRLLERTVMTPSVKKLRWHVDYLLDLPEAELIHVVLIRSPLRIEQKLAELVEKLDGISRIAPRLGAQDTKGSTHLLKLANCERLLDQLCRQIPKMIKN
jgi:Uri superfamily endonuclease